MLNIPDGKGGVEIPENICWLDMYLTRMKWTVCEIKAVILIRIEGVSVGDIHQEAVVVPGQGPDGLVVAGEGEARYQPPEGCWAASLNLKEHLQLNVSIFFFHQSKLTFWK